MIDDSDRYFARQWLRSHKTDVHKMITLRNVLWKEQSTLALSRTSEEEIVGQIADLLKRNHVVIPRNEQIFKSPSQLTGGAAPVAQKSAAFPLSERKARAAAAQTGSQPNTEASPYNGSVMAAAMTSASQKGTPLCEECLKNTAQGEGS